MTLEGSDRLQIVEENMAPRGDLCTQPLTPGCVCRQLYRHIDECLVAGGDEFRQIQLAHNAARQFPTHELALAGEDGQASLDAL